MADRRSGGHLRTVFARRRATEDLVVDTVDDREVHEPVDVVARPSLGAEEGARQQVVELTAVV